tara:strand:- start:449 stop:670 length:222 start_codon:yes stop_codon:yes gene_type:complete
MKFGVKKIFSKKNMIGLKKGLRTAGKIGVKAGQIAMAVAPAVALTGPQGVAIASGLEVGGMAAAGAGTVLAGV